MTCANVASLTLSADVRYDLSMTTYSKLTPGTRIQYMAGHMVATGTVLRQAGPALNPRLIKVVLKGEGVYAGQEINLHVKPRAHSTVLATPSNV